MTERRSDYTLRYFTFLLRKLKTCIILSVIFAFLGFPCVTFVDYGSSDDLHMKTIFMALSAVSIAGSFVISFAAPLIARSYLFTKASADNILSLPLTAFQRFISETGASFFCVVLTGVISLPLTSIACITSWKHNQWLQICFAFAMSLMMFVALNLFLTNLCGRLAEAILYPIAFNVIMPLLAALASWFSCSNIFGVYGHGFEASYMALAGYTSPIGSMLYFSFTTGSGAWLLLSAPVYVLIFLALGWLTYRSRPVENTGYPFVYKKAYGINSVIIAVGCVVSYIALYAMLLGDRKNPFSFAGGVVLAILLLILLLIMEFINYKKINSFPKFLIKYVGTLAAGALISFGLYASEGFGAAWYIPSADEALYISGHAMTYSNSSDMSQVVSFAVSGDDNSLSQLIRAEQKRIIENHADAVTGTSNLWLNYRLKNGSVISRSYYRDSLPPDFMESIISTPEYKLTGLTGFEKDYGIVEKYDENGTTFITDASKEGPIAVKFCNAYTGREYFFANDIDYSALKAALTADLENDNQYGRHSDFPVGNIIIGQVLRSYAEDSYGNIENIDYIWSGTTAEYSIFESYTNTIAFLKKYGNVPDAEAALSDAVSGAPLISVMRVPLKTDQTIFTNRRYTGSYYRDDISAVFINEDEYRQIASFPEYISSGNEYAYYLKIGAPKFFDLDSVYGVDSDMLSQLSESGIMSGGEGFVYNADAYPTRVNDSEYLISEEYYPLLERYFSDRYVFSRP